jgi:hypothetical protein
MVSGLFEEVVGDFASGRVSGGDLAFDFHLEDFVGAFAGDDLGMSKKCDEAFLNGAESPFDLPLACGEGAMRCATPMALNARWNSLRGLRWSCEELGPKRLRRRCRWLVGCRSAQRLRRSGESGPSSVSGEESSGDVEPGVVVESEQESLFCGNWPPLEDGTVVLEGFTESGATKAVIGAWLFSG